MKRREKSAGAKLTKLAKLTILLFYMARRRGRLRRGSGAAPARLRRGSGAAPARLPPLLLLL